MAVTRHPDNDRNLGHRARLAERRAFITRHIAAWLVEVALVPPSSDTDFGSELSADEPKDPEARDRSNGQGSAS